MKLSLLVLMLPMVTLGCSGDKPNSVKQLQINAKEIEEHIQKSQHEIDGQKRQDEVFMQLGKKMTYEQFQDYVARISDDDPSNDQGVQ
jgi:hypothetical protein